MSAKTAEQVPNDENYLEPGKIEVQKDPPGRAPGTLQAKWGDKPKLDEDGYPIQYGSGVAAEVQEDRHGVLNRLFDEMGISGPADRAFINQYFDTKDRRTAHSPFLQEKAAEQELRSIVTLRERVHGIIRE